MNINSSTGRKPPESVIMTKLNSDEWNLTLKYLFAPNELGSDITVFKLYPATLGDWNNGFAGGYAGKTYLDNIGTHDYGIVTALSAAYTPNPNHYVGFEYNFKFERQ